MREAYDEGLRRRALEKLGAYGDALAREALESGAVVVERGVTCWQGSLGTVEGHRAVLVLEAELALRVQAAPATLDALTAAIAAAIAESAGNALVELVLDAGTRPPSRTPYRGP